MTTAKILDGKDIARRIREDVKQEVAELKAQYGIIPGLAVIIVGDNPASQVYVRRKHQACLEMGIYSEVLCLPGQTSEAELLEQIDMLNKNPNIHGILVQLPLPKHIDTDRVINHIHPAKDVDGFHPINVGKLCIGQEELVSCTPYGIIKMLEMEGISLKGKNAVIIGRSNIVGKPMALLLLSRDATVTVCHSKTQALAAITSQADILIAAIGKPRFVTRDMVKQGAVVIDVGINRVDNKLIGDVDFEQVKEIASYITPVPGGVGPLTITMLLYNTVKTAKILHNIK